MTLDFTVTDRVVPTEESRVWTAGAAVKLCADDQKQTTVSVLSMFNDRVRKTPDSLALAEEENGEWKKWTFKEYFDTSVAAAKSLIKLGLQSHHSACILGFNSPEWFFASWGAIIAGGFSTGVYTTNSPETCQHIMLNSACNVVLVDSDMQLKKIMKIKGNLPELKNIVQFKGTPTTEGVLSWEEFLKEGQDVADDEVQRRLENIAPNKCCSLIYTSGTTGDPKGVMISHDNINYVTRLTNEVLAKEQMTVDTGGRQVSYLPLSHIAAGVCDIYLAIYMGNSVHFARPDALRGTLAKTLLEVRPTFFIGVPRVFEKFKDALEPAVKKGLAGKHLAELIGLNQVPHVCLISAAAPLAHDTLKFFNNADVPVVEVYGMSECAGPHTIGVPSSNKFGSVGKADTIAKTVMNNVGEDSGAEICMRGRHVFMGYLNMKDKTLEALDEDGLLHSGDLGKVDEDGFLRITGRLKELVITAGGENVPPVPIENRVKAAQPTLISNCMVVGDRRKFLSLLVCLKSNVHPLTTAPLDELSSEVIAYLTERGSKSTTVSEVIECKDAAVYEAIQAAVTEANSGATSRAQMVQKFQLLPADFSVPSGEIGPSLKLRRTIVLKKYAKLIDEIYQ